MSKLVSIIMNCRNGDEFLKESLNSVINQTYKNWELIFVDNISTDRSKNIYTEYKDNRFKYFNTKKILNLGEARQFALSNCKGEYIAFLDTDDLWMKNKLEKQIPYFLNPKVGMVISNTIFFTKKNEKIFYRMDPPTGNVFSKILKKYFISLETLICKKEFIDKISFTFDKEFTMISDLDLTLRLSKVSELEYSPDILAKWRIHQNSETWKKTKIFFLERLKLYKKLKIDKKINNNISIEKSLEEFKNNTIYSYIFQQIENKEKKNYIYENLKEIKRLKIKYLFTFLLVNFPLNNILLKIYRKFTKISP